MDGLVPMVEPLLEQIRLEYTKEPPAWKYTKPTAEILEYALGIAQQKDPFDTLHLKADFAEPIQTGSAGIHQTVCSHGTILVLTLPGDSFDPPWNTWWRAVRLLCPTKKVRIVVFAHPRKRLPPSYGMPLKEEHVNGGSTFKCNSTTIVVYRKEEATRVMIHELFHGNCSDPYEKSIEEVEADTEAWAELVLCGMTAKGDPVLFQKVWQRHLQYALKQATLAHQHHNVESPRDYAWRYLVGRLDVWRRLGFQIPQEPKHYTRPSTLRFTQCEPENV